MKNVVEHYNTLSSKEEKQKYFEACLMLINAEDIDSIVEIFGQLNNYRFLQVYCRLHLKKYGEQFIVN